jgi:hypothetical protein
MNDKVMVLKPSLPDPMDKVSVVDLLALLLLKDFISSGFPAIDPLKQVDAAYAYAELMSQRRKP